jgi:allophanate hydrolase subunit 2
MFNLSKGSIAYTIYAPNVGKQALGISPQGPSDQRSFFTAHTLLGEPIHYQTAEIIHARTITFTEDVIFTLVGAYYDRIHLDHNPIYQATVYKATKNTTLHFGKKTKGFRLYLMSTPLTHKTSQQLGKSRGPFENHFLPCPKKIRVFEGPEYSYLTNPTTFFSTPYKISNNSSLMGLKLIGEPLQAKQYDIISSAVTDGTIQLTQNGPIILMRHRQTTGGYPRVLQVIDADLDCLAQYAVGELVWFEKVLLEEAKKHIFNY